MENKETYDKEISFTGHKIECTNDRSFFISTLTFKGLIWNVEQEVEPFFAILQSRDVEIGKIQDSWTRQFFPSPVLKYSINKYNIAFKESNPKS